MCVERLEIVNECFSWAMMVIVMVMVMVMVMVTIAFCIGYLLLILNTKWRRRKIEWLCRYAAGTYCVVSIDINRGIISLYGFTQS